LIGGESVTGVNWRCEYFLFQVGSLRLPVHPIPFPANRPTLL
jgi:hypothetical protein